MKATLIALTGLLTAASFCACSNNNDDTSNMVNTTDSTFVMMAAMSNSAEVGASQLAVAISTDTAIINYANMMIADHTAAQSDLKNLATKYGLTAPDSIDVTHAEVMVQMAMKTGRAFDSMYIHNQVIDHQTSVQLFQTETTGGNNTELKSFANSKLPTLQMHLDHANSIAAGY